MSISESEFPKIYVRHYSRIVRYFVGMFHFEIVEAEELAQETFIRFYTHAADFQPGSEQAILWTTARHIGLNNLRAKQSQKRHGKLVELDGPDAESIRESVPSDDDPSQEVAEEQVESVRRQRLAEAIAALPAGSREALRLHLNERSYAEIAQALQISLDAVKSRLRDAKRQLRSRLEDDDKAGSQSA